MSKDMFYSIGQVSKYAGLPQSVLRYWETVFDQLSPRKSAGGSRQYSETDVEIVLQIKKLLYEQGFTIKGANKNLNAIWRQKSTDPLFQVSDTKDKIAGNLSKKSEKIITKNRIFERGNLAGERYDDAVIKELKNILKILDRN